MELDPSTVPWGDRYRILTGSIVPRPIGWISTIGPDGIYNIAPYSFFNAACAQPMIVTFAPMRRSDGGEKKDTLHNVEVTGEFVVNIVSEPLLEAMDRTGEAFAADIDEFVAVGLTPVPSRVVKAPRIAEAPIHFECRLVQVVHFGDAAPGSGALVIGEVVHVHVDDAVLDGDRIDAAKLRPVARLGGPWYARPQIIEYRRRTSV